MHSPVKKDSGSGGHESDPGWVVGMQVKGCIGGRAEGAGDIHHSTSLSTPGAPGTLRVTHEAHVGTLKLLVHARVRNVGPGWLGIFQSTTPFSSSAGAAPSTQSRCGRRTSKGERAARGVGGDLSKHQNMRFIFFVLSFSFFFLPAPGIQFLLVKRT